MVRVKLKVRYHSALWAAKNRVMNKIILGRTNLYTEFRCASIYCHEIELLPGL